MHQVIEEPCASGWCLKQTEGQNTEVRALFTTFYVKMAQVSESKSFKIKLLQNKDPGRDGDRSKLPCEETKRLEGEMRGGGIFLFIKIEMMKVKRELRRE